MAKKKAAASATAEAERTWTRKEAEDHVRGLNLRCLGPRDPAKYKEWQKLMAAGKIDEARLIQTRTGCGYDFGQTVIAGGFDGEEHEATCPRCGTVTSYRAPTFAGAKP